MRSPSGPWRRTPRSRHCRCRPRSALGSRASASRARRSSRRCCPEPTAALPGCSSASATGPPGEPSGPSELLIGHLAQSLPTGSYRLASEARDPTLAAIAWGLGSYRYTRYKNSNTPRAVSLRLPDGADRELALEHHRCGASRPRPYQYAGLRPRTGRDRGCRAGSGDAVRRAYRGHGRRRSARQEFPDDPCGRACQPARATS